MDSVESVTAPTPSPKSNRLAPFLDEYSSCQLNKTPQQEVGLRNDVSRWKAIKTGINPLHFCTPIKDQRCGKKQRAAALGLDLLESSFEHNQSFPKICKSKLTMDAEVTSSKQKCSADQVRVDGPNGVRFNSSLANVATEVPSQISIGSFDRLQQGINPNKAVFTIDAKTSKILIVNSKACQLLEYSSTELCNICFYDLLRDGNPKKLPLYTAQDGDSNAEDGPTVVLSGKVVEMVSGSGNVIVVSLWIRQLDTDGPCLAVAEPVYAKQALITVDGDSSTVVASSSEDCLILFQSEPEKLIGLQISSLVPSIALPQGESPIPKHIAKQKATGRTLDGSTFPLCLWIRNHRPSDKFTSLQESIDKHKQYYDITIRVYHNVSGLLVVDDAGLVSACNHYFTMLTFGKTHAEVIGQPMMSIIPSFCQDIQLLRPSSSRSRNVTMSPVPNDDTDSDTEPTDSCGLGNYSRKSPTISLNVNHSQLSQVTIDKSSSAVYLDKSCCIPYDKTHTPTPTQDMVSSISTTEQRIDTDQSAIPDVTSDLSALSVEENGCCPTLSKSQSENILVSDNRENNINIANKFNQKGSELSESVYFTSDAPKNRLNDSNLRLSFDGSKCRHSKSAALKKEDKLNLSLEACDSNETSADFLTPINEMPKSTIGDAASFDLDEESSKSLCADKADESRVNTVNGDSPKKPSEKDWSISTPPVIRRTAKSCVTTSTPQINKKKLKHPQKSCELSSVGTCRDKDGTYKGTIIHKDGTELGIVYTVSSMQLSSGSSVQYVWLSVQNPDDGLHMTHATLASSINSTADNSLATGKDKSNVSRPLSVSIVSHCEDQISGDYSKYYVTLKQIGKGAYGCVKMAYRRTDRLLVVAKFILKEKVNHSFWVDSPEKVGKKVPLEVSLLQTIKHPNIVSVLDVYENERYFQMIMEKHGSGMDLFEFIERRPQLDEPLISYIFRQIGQAVEYLHSLNILHRDIKDENIIIDSKFHIKLIDFGSATFMHDGVLFSTFYGTTEYCSPEVLTGNKYAGPELEMWSMGITLFVLVFFENPYTDIEDIIHGKFTMSKAISADLDHLLNSMLCKDPVARCTIPQLMAHPWINQLISPSKYNFSEILECETFEAAPEVYYSGGWGSRSASPVSHVDNPAKVTKADSRYVSKDDPKRNSMVMHNPLSTDKDAHSDNYSLRSSADILDISSKPMSDAALTDISSDATGHAACDIDYDIDQYDCDSWDECEQDSFS